MPRGIPKDPEAARSKTAAARAANKAAGKKAAAVAVRTAHKAKAARWIEVPGRPEITVRTAKDGAVLSVEGLDGVGRGVIPRVKVVEEEAAVAEEAASGWELVLSPGADGRTRGWWRPAGRPGPAAPPGAEREEAADAEAPSTAPAKAELEDRELRSRLLDACAEFPPVPGGGFAACLRSLYDLARPGRFDRGGARTAWARARALEVAVFAKGGRSMGLGLGEAVELAHELFEFLAGAGEAPREREEPPLLTPAGRLAALLPADLTEEEARELAMRVGVLRAKREEAGKAAAYAAAAAEDGWP